MARNLDNSDQNHHLFNEHANIFGPPQDSKQKDHHQNSHHHQDYQFEPFPAQQQQHLSSATGFGSLGCRPWKNVWDVDNYFCWTGIFFRGGVEKYCSCQEKCSRWWHMFLSIHPLTVVEAASLFPRSPIVIRPVSFKLGQLGIEMFGGMLEILESSQKIGIFGIVACFLEILELRPLPQAKDRQ